MESFFSTAQFELLSRNRFEKLEDARAAITEWTDGFYNSEWRHTAIEGTSPIKYELS
jgi:putative transposase